MHIEKYKKLQKESKGKGVVLIVSLIQFVRSSFAILGKPVLYEIVSQIIQAKLLFPFKSFEARYYMYKCTKT